MKSSVVGPLFVLLRKATAPEIKGVSWLTADRATDKMAIHTSAYGMIERIVWLRDLRCMKKNIASINGGVVVAVHTLCHFLVTPEHPTDASPQHSTGAIAIALESWVSRSSVQNSNAASKAITAIPIRTAG